MRVSRVAYGDGTHLHAARVLTRLSTDGGGGYCCSLCTQPSRCTRTSETTCRAEQVLDGFP